jgi:hypothetical protein
METGDRDEWDTVTRFRDEQLCSEEDRLLVDINVRTLDMNGSILDDLVKLLFRPSNRVPGYISTAYLCKVEFGATWGTHILLTSTMSSRTQAKESRALTPSSPNGSGDGTEVSALRMSMAQSACEAFASKALPFSQVKP